MTNKKTTKKALIFSALSLLLCFSMLIGTTFAWFTDSVTSSGNIIQSGTLKIDLEHYDPETGEWNSIKESKAPIFTYENWEPGYVDVQLLKIENEGSLALKWVATFKSDVELSKLADVIDVYVKPSATEITYPTSRDDIANWEKVGTVAEFVNTIEETTNGTLLEGESAYLGIALKMQETAGNEYQGQKLGEFTIQILATQMTAELDSFGPDYDKAAPWTGKVDVDWYTPNATEYTISSAEELAGLAQIVNTCVDSFAGKTVKLASNINLNNLAWTPIGDVDADDFVGFQGTFDGQGYTIANLKIDSNSWGQGLFGYMTKNITIQNVNIHNATVKAADTCGVIVGYATYGTFSNIHVTGNVTVSGSATDGHVGGIAGCGYNATFENCSVIANGEITSAGSFAGGIVGYQCNNTKTIKDCSVEGLTITGYAAVGGISGIVQTGSAAIDNCSVKNVVLNKTRVDGDPSIGALVGNYSGTAATTLTGKVENVTLNGTHVAYAAYNELYGSEYSGATAPDFDVTGVTVSNITNNLISGLIVSDEASLKEALVTGGDIVLAADIAVSEAVIVPRNAHIMGNGNTIYRADGYTGTVISVNSGVTLTTSDVIIDGGAVWAGRATYGANTANNGVVATGNLIATTGNANVVLNEGTIVQNNDGANAISLATRGGGSLTLNGAWVINNRSAAGAIWGGDDIIINEGSKINGNHATSIGGAIRMVNGNYGITLTMNGGEMNYNTSDGTGGAIWGGNKAYYYFNGGEMAYNSAVTAGGAIWTGNYEAYYISGDFKMHDNTAGELGGAIRFSDHASLTMTGGSVYNNTINGKSNAFYLNNNTATITGGSIADDFSYSGGLGLTIGEADIDGVIAYGLSTNHNTAYLAAEFGTIRFTVNPAADNFSQFNFKPAADYVYTAGDEAKLVCLTEGYTTYWDAATSTFRLKAN